MDETQGDSLGSLGPIHSEPVTIDRTLGNTHPATNNCHFHVIRFHRVEPVSNSNRLNPLLCAFFVLSSILFSPPFCTQQDSNNNMSAMEIDKPLEEVS